MKLELKHIKAYPSNLEVLIRDDDGCYFTDKIESINLRYGIIEIYEGWDFDINKEEIERLQLKLRPLIDLTKEIEHGGDKFFPWDKLADKLLDEEPESFDNSDSAKKWVETYFADTDILNLPYKLVAKLFEWHFDVYGLIDKGLAVVSNSL